MAQNRNVSAFSRRAFLQVSTAASTAAALGVVTEPVLACAARPTLPPDGAVVIDANENPLGPCQTALEAMSAILDRKSVV